VLLTFLHLTTRAGNDVELILKICDVLNGHTHTNGPYTFRILVWRTHQSHEYFLMYSVPLYLLSGMTRIMTQRILKCGCPYCGSGATYSQLPVLARL